ncbi:MAG: SIMPL domain-containing protein [Candidatus Symbiodolus clandestinus]
MLRQPLIACLLGVSLSAVVVAAAAAEVPSEPHIAIIGRSRVAVKPDQALIQLQITQETQDTNSAKQQIDRRVSRYLIFLKQQGIQSSQIDASRLWSQRIEKPETKVTVAGHKKQQIEKPKAKAAVTERKKPGYYRLSRQLTITVQSLGLVEPLLTEALRCGLQELQSIQFGVADENQYRQQARKLAIQDAIQQAEQIAQQFSSRRGTIYSIRYRSSEPSAYFASRSVAFAATANSDQAQSYLPPILYFTDQVEATFRLQF